jgi:molybdopterin converting factor small subunit
VANFRILLFAVAREVAGMESVQVDVDLPITAGDLMEVIGQKLPPLMPWLPSCRLAVAQQYVPSEYVITEVLEVALVPPVSGG